MRRLTKRHFEVLAEVRYALRRFLRFSEDGARRAGLTPQQHQILLALKGYPGREWATVGELAERLQLRHQSAVGLVDRVEQAGFVTRRSDPIDHRVVRIGLTAAGERVLDRLAALHLVELKLLGPKLALVARLPRVARGEGPAGRPAGQGPVGTRPRRRAAR